jgi:hypothetical protein
MTSFSLDNKTFFSAVVLEKACWFCNKFGVKPLKAFQRRGIMNRYEECDENLVEVFMRVLEERFPGYGNLKFKLIFDTKKRVRQGKLLLATIELANEKIKFFSKDDVAVDGYDYVLIVDKKAWELAGEKDKERLISHELRHVFVDEKGGCKITGHEIEDFYSEIKLNQDDPEWGRKLSTVVSDVYEQEKEDKKAANHEQ